MACCPRLRATVRPRRLFLPLEALRLDFDFDVLDSFDLVDFEVLLKELALFVVPFFACLVAAAETVTNNSSAQST